MSEEIRIPGAHFVVTQPGGVTKLVFTHTEWDAMLTATFEEIKWLATKKGGEYSGDTDRLANFRRNAEALGLDYRQIWAVYAAKHWDAVMQSIKDIAAGKVRDRAEPLEGRIHD